MPAGFGSNKWEDLFSNLREEVLVVGADRTVLYANQPVVERLGPSLDRIVGRPCHYVFQRDANCCRAVERECAVKRVLESGQAAPFVCRQSPSARRRDYPKVEAFPLRDANGGLTAVMCLPRKSGRLERYERILSTMSEGVAVVSRGGRIIEVNSALCHMLGFSPGELVGHSVSDFTASDVTLPLRDASKDNGATVELGLTRKDGSTLAAEVTVSRLSPELSGLYIAFVRDITVRKQRDGSIAEESEAVIKSAAEYRAIFEGSNDALVIIEDDTTVAIVNRRFEEITGYRWHEVEGKMSFLTLICEEDRDQALAVHRMRRERSQAAQPCHKLWIIAKDGQRLLAEVAGAMIPGSKRSVVAFRDITEAHALLQKLERQNREFEVLHSVTALLSGSTNLSTMLDLVLDKVIELAGESRAVIYLKDEEQPMLLVRAHTGHEKDRIHVKDRLAVGEGFEGRVAQTGKPIFVADTRQNQHLTRAAVPNAGLLALACVPLVSSGNVLGVMSITTTAPREFSPDEQRLLISIGNQIGMATERAQRLERVRDKAREVSSLMLVTQDIASSLELQQILDRTLSIMCMQVWADQGGICLLDETSGELVAKSLWGEEAFLPGRVWKLGQGIAGWAAAHQLPILCDDAATDPRLHLSSAPDLGYHSMIAVPLKAADKVLGVVVVASRRIGAFAQSHLRLMSTYATQASLALEKALLFQRVKDEASSLAEALRQLAASEHRFRALIEHSSDSILLLTAGGEITYASPSNTRISGWATADMAGVELFELIDLEDRDKALARFDEAIKEPGCVKTAELRARNKEGQRSWIKVTFNNLLEEPDVQGVVVNWRDISERKRMERERERLITILEATPDIVVICDVNGRLLYANRAACRALKLEEDDLPSNRNIAELVQDKTRTRLTNEIMPAVIRDGGWTGEITSPGLDGEEIATLIVAQAHKAPDGSIEFMSTIARDITELKMGDRATQAAAEEWRTTFDGITEGILVLNTERRVLRCNLAMQTFLGLPFDEILGRGCCDLICGDSEGKEDCTAFRVLQTKRKETSILQVADRWFAITVYPLQNPDQGLGGLVFIMSDISEENKAEEALRESEKKIRMLAEASARAQEEERRSFADEVHDRIAQTLVAVHQQLQALRKASQNDVSTHRMVSRTLELQQRAIDETRNIMKALYSPTLEQYGLVTAIEEELHQLQEYTGFQTRIDADCPSRPPKHVEGILYRIFHEALMNVRKHSAGAKLVAVSVKWEHDNVGIVIQDDGPGFDVKAVTKNKSFGGLVSMRRRAEIIGGSFEVESNPVQGTRVSASVPVQEANDPSLDE